MLSILIAIKIYKKIFTRGLCLKGSVIAPWKPD